MKKLIISCAFILFIVCGVCVVNAAQIEMDYNDGIYHFVLTGDKIKKQIKFISSPNLITNKEAHTKSGSLLTVNAGFFDPNNQKTISYISHKIPILKELTF